MRTLISVKVGDRALHGALRGNHRNDLHLGNLTDLIDRVIVQRVVHRHIKRIPLLLDRNQMVLARGIAHNDLGKLLRYVDTV